MYDEFYLLQSVYYTWLTSIISGNMVKWNGLHQIVNKIQDNKAIIAVFM